MGLWRTGWYPPSGPFWDIYRVSASDWRDPTTYVPEYKDLFPMVGVVEDPDVWVDAEGRFHAVFHHETGCTVPWVCVGHAFSLDSKTWHYPFVVSTPPLAAQALT